MVGKLWQGADNLNIPLTYEFNDSPFVPPAGRVSSIHVKEGRLVATVHCSEEAKKVTKKANYGYCAVTFACNAKGTKATIELRSLTLTHSPVPEMYKVSFVYE